MVHIITVLYKPVFIYHMNGKYDARTEKVLKHFGKRLRKLRKEKGYSNYETFAHEAGISRIQYGRYENGANITLVNLVKVLDALGVSLEEFFSDGFGKKP